MLLYSCRILLKFFMDFADGTFETPFAVSNQESKSTCRSEKTDRGRCIMMSIVQVFHVGLHESDSSKNIRSGRTSQSGQGYQSGSLVCDLGIRSLACRLGLVGIFNDSRLTEKVISAVSQVIHHCNQDTTTSELTFFHVDIAVKFIRPVIGNICLTHDIQDNLLEDICIITRM